MRGRLSYSVIGSVRCHSIAASFIEFLFLVASPPAGDDVMSLFSTFPIPRICLSDKASKAQCSLYPCLETPSFWLDSDAEPLGHPAWHKVHTVGGSALPDLGTTRMEIADRHHRTVFYRSIAVIWSS